MQCGSWSGGSTTRRSAAGRSRCDARIDITHAWVPQAGAFPWPLPPPHAARCCWPYRPPPLPLSFSNFFPPFPLAPLPYLQEVPVLHEVVDGQPLLQPLPQHVVHVDDLLRGRNAKGRGTGREG